MLEDILICPRTGNRISLNAGNGVANVEHPNLSYPIRDDTLDLLPDTVDRVPREYDAFAPHFDTHYAAHLGSVFYFTMGRKWR